MWFALPLCVFLGSWSIIEGTSLEPVVQVQQGKLLGRRVKSNNGNSFWSFQGIPYARPPVGDLRFKPAQPAESWGDITRHASKEGSSCLQFDWIYKRLYLGDEDCLYLNVYTNKLPSSTEKVKYAVLVWIHGGRFEMGSGNADWYGPDFLLAENVVVVTINYRLGIFGFLNIEDDSVHKNLGLKDQVAALRWVKENIAVFGGDPDNVTIFGETAGGASVHFHTLSPMSKGLFHRAIIQGGCALNTWALDNISEELSFQVAKTLGSNANTVPNVLSFLKTASAQDLVKTVNEISQKDQLKGNFRPMVEKKPIPGDEVFLPAHPQEIIQQQNHSIPFIIGLASKMGIVVLHILGALNNPEKLKFSAEHLEKFVPKGIVEKYGSKEIAEKLRSFYLGNKSTDNTSLTNGLVDIISDAEFAIKIDEAVKLSAKGPSPVFYYNFDFSGKLNFLKHFLNISYLPGASHLDKEGYLFAKPFYKMPEVGPDSREGITRKRMVKLWTNFAKTGNPTPELDPVIGVQWPRFTLEKAEYLDISDTLKVKKDLNKERIEFWKKL